MDSKFFEATNSVKLEDDSKVLFDQTFLKGKCYFNIQNEI